MTEGLGLSTSRALAKPPHGQAECYAFAEWDTAQMLRSDGTPMPAWEAAWIQRLAIPRELAYLDGSTITRVAVHRKAAPSLLAALTEINRVGLWSYLQPYGGGFNFRLKRGSSRLSMHALGLAVDFDPEANAMGVPVKHTRFGGTTEGLAVVRLFALYGWSWGGRFERPDAMHFQFGTGY